MLKVRWTDVRGFLQTGEERMGIMAPDGCERVLVNSLVPLVCLASMIRVVIFISHNCTLVIMESR